MHQRAAVQGTECILVPVREMRIVWVWQLSIQIRIAQTRKVNVGVLQLARTKHRTDPIVLCTCSTLTVLNEFLPLLSCLFEPLLITLDFTQTGCILTDLVELVQKHRRHTR